jgi:hypothetical protein
MKGEGEAQKGEKKNHIQLRRSINKRGRAIFTMSGEGKAKNMKYQMGN